MKLFYTPGACSLSPHIVAREAGLDIALAKVDLRSKKLEDGTDFANISPKAYVPVLELDDGTVLTEGAVIVQYLADLAPATGLLPDAGTPARYRAQELLNFIASEIHKPMGSFFNPAQTPEWRAGMEATLAKRLGVASSLLGDKPYLAGETFAAPDAYLFTILSWADHVKFDLSPWPNLVAFKARVGGRPKVQEALKAEGLMA